MKFTPGPWVIEFDKETPTGCIYAPNSKGSHGDPIVIVDLGELELPDAYLIAAAPLGYALAEEIVNHLYTKQDIDRVRAMAKEFIAEADGGQ